ncbi:14221_t:CDS:2, partial [Racocetra fulgida]
NASDEEANKNKQSKKGKRKANNASDEESSNQFVTDVEVDKNKQDLDTDNEDFSTNNEILALLKRLETLEKLQAASKYGKEIPEFRKIPENEKRIQGFLLLLVIGLLDE